MAARITIRRLDDAMRALDPDILVGPARKLLTRSAIKVQGRARENAPVDRGGLRDSIAYEVDSSYFPRYAEIGSNLVYARPTELGRPAGKMPPVGPLEAWARRKGMGEGAGWPIALHIMNNGTEPKPYLMPALNESEPAIKKYVTQMAVDVEREAASRGGG